MKGMVCLLVGLALLVELAQSQVPTSFVYPFEGSDATIIYVIVGVFCFFCITHALVCLFVVLGCIRNRFLANRQAPQPINRVPDSAAPRSAAQGTSASSEARAERSGDSRRALLGSRHRDIVNLEAEMQDVSSDLTFSPGLCRFDGDNIKMVHLVRAVDQTDKRLVNTFKVELTNIGIESFLKWYTVPVKFKMQQHLLCTLEVKLQSCMQGGSIYDDFHHFPKFFGLVSWKGQSKLGYLTEFCPGGNMRKAVQRRLSFAQRLRLLASVAHHLRAMERHDLVYKALNRQNILVMTRDIPEEPLASDDLMELTRIRDVRYDVIMGGLFGIENKIEFFHYYAPEVFSGDKEAISTKTDVYAFGFLMYEILTENFQPMHRQVSQGKSFFGPQVVSDAAFRPEVGVEIRSDDSLAWYLGLMDLCWGMDPKSRPSFSNIISVLKKHEDSPGGGNLRHRRSASSAAKAKQAESVAKSKAGGGSDSGAAAAAESVGREARDGVHAEFDEDFQAAAARPKVAGGRARKSAGVAEIPDHDGHFPGATLHVGAVGAAALIEGGGDLVIESVSRAAPPPAAAEGSSDSDLGEGSMPMGELLDMIPTEEPGELEVDVPLLAISEPEPDPVIHSDLVQPMAVDISDLAVVELDVGSDEEDERVFPSLRFDDGAPPSAYVPAPKQTSLPDAVEHLPDIALTLTGDFDLDVDVGDLADDSLESEQMLARSPSKRSLRGGTSIRPDLLDEDESSDDMHGSGVLVEESLRNVSLRDVRMDAAPSIDAMMGDAEEDMMDFHANMNLTRDDEESSDSYPRAAAKKPERKPKTSGDILFDEDSDDLLGSDIDDGLLPSKHVDSDDDGMFDDSDDNSEDLLL